MTFRGHIGDIYIGDIYIGDIYIYIGDIYVITCVLWLDLLL